MKKGIKKLNVKALAIAVGATWGAFVLMIGLSAAWFNWGKEFVNVIGKLYIGYTPTLLGSLIGTLWGLLDGAIAGAIVALIYNWAAKK